jgi:hypothetical protein
MINTLIESDFTTAKLTDNENWTVTNPLYTGSTSPITSYSASTDVFGGTNKFGTSNSTPRIYTKIGKVFSGLTMHDYLEFTVTLYTFGK